MLWGPDGMRSPEITWEGHSRQRGGKPQAGGVGNGPGTPGPVDGAEGWREAAGEAGGQMLPKAVGASKATERALASSHWLLRAE